MQARHYSKHFTDFILLETHWTFLSFVESFMYCAPDHRWYRFYLIRMQSLLVNSSEKRTVPLETFLPLHADINRGLKIEFLLSERRGLLALILLVPLFERLHNYWFLRHFIRIVRVLALALIFYFKKTDGHYLRWQLQVIGLCLCEVMVKFKWDMNVAVVETTGGVRRRLERTLIDLIDFIKRLGVTFAVVWHDSITCK